MHPGLFRLINGLDSLFFAWDDKVVGVLTQCIGFDARRLIVSLDELEDTNEVIATMSSLKIVSGRLPAGLAYIGERQKVLEHFFVNLLENADG